jgi:hypothetical protein
MNEPSAAFVKAFGLCLASVFAVVGGLFVLLPGGTLAFFNSASRRLGMVEGPVEASFFVVLAGAYMFVVTVLAWRMSRSPLEKIYPLILGQAKLASSLLSFLMFAIHAPWLILLVNGIVDGALALVVWIVYRRIASGRGGAGA